MSRAGSFVRDLSPASSASPCPILRADGTQEWRLDGILHRLDGPAVIHADGSEAWFVHGGRHRPDGPAFVGSDGRQKWYHNNSLHRLDGPAILWPDGPQEWYVDSKRHRLDGPAILWTDGTEAWYVDGHDITLLSAHAKMAYIQKYIRTTSDTSVPCITEVLPPDLDPKDIL